MRMEARVNDERHNSVWSTTLWAHDPMVLDTNPYCHVHGVQSLRRTTLWGARLYAAHDTMVVDVAPYCHVRGLQSRRRTALWGARLSAAHDGVVLDVAPYVHVRGVRSLRRTTLGGARLYGGVARHVLLCLRQSLRHSNDPNPDFYC